jgi:hypothetical protein
MTRPPLPQIRLGVSRSSGPFAGYTNSLRRYEKAVIIGTQKYSGLVVVPVGTS